MLRKIADRIWIGSTPTVKMIEECGADAVFCCIKAGTPHEVTTLVGDYRGMPIPDGKKWDESRFNSAAQIVERWLAKGRTVLIHCRAGRNRSAALAAILLIRQGWEPQAAIDFIREIRPRAIANPVFEERLLQGGF